MKFKEFMMLFEETKHLMVSDPKYKLIWKKATTDGLPLYRGNTLGRKPSDPGDFGKGPYYTTHKLRAKQYGEVKKEIIKFKNPLVLTIHAAYDLSDKYNTLHAKDRHKASEKMARAILRAGFDGLIAVNKWRGVSELEVVDFNARNKNAVN